MKRSLRNAGLVILLLCAGRVAASAAGPLPAPKGYVNDFAGMLSSSAEVTITEIAREVKAKTGAEIAVATVRTTGGQDIEQYAVDLFMTWGVGEKGKDNGVLVVVALDDRKLWIKTGYGLEGAIPDATAHAIYRDVLKPGFRSGQYDQAVVTAVGMLAERILADQGMALDHVVPERPAFKGHGSQLPSWLPGLAFAIIMIVIAVLARRTKDPSGYDGPGFWTGGGYRGSSSSSFGGGSGGFSGGSCGGGGAGGGW